MDKFKDFYNNKNGKIILFFGFYLIFFVFLGIYMKNVNNEQNNIEKDNTNIDEKITTYDISNLINNDYQYNISITDNSDTITFSGTKSNIDYANFSNKFFLDIYNINQLLKRSKYLDSENNVLFYELNNSVINDLLLTTKEKGINKISVFVNAKREIKRITMDLSQYMEKEKYEIIINYQVGDNNENSIS